MRRQPGRACELEQQRRGSCCVMRWREKSSSQPSCSRCKFCQRLGSSAVSSRKCLRPMSLACASTAHHAGRAEFSFCAMDERSCSFGGTPILLRNGCGARPGGRAHRNESPRAGRALCYTMEHDETADLQMGQQLGGASSGALHARGWNQGRGQRGSGINSRRQNHLVAATTLRQGGLYEKGAKTARQYADDFGYRGADALRHALLHLLRHQRAARARRSRCSFPSPPATA